MNSQDPQAPAFAGTVLNSYISPDPLSEATRAAADRKIALSHILHYEYGVPRQALLKALEEYYQCTSIEYDERLPIPPELLLNLPEAQMVAEGWFPVLKDVDGGIVVAAIDPNSTGLRKAVAQTFGPVNYEFRVTLSEDIVWFAQDYLNAPPGKLIGTERTNLAFWRNTMAQWRTRLACYRTDLAKARTALAGGRTGLGLTILADTLWRSNKFNISSWVIIGVLVVGILLILFNSLTYLHVRRSRIKPPRDQTLVEVTAATLTFLENFHFSVETDNTATRPSKDTMLARLGDFLYDYCTIIYPVPASRERTHLARERNLLAAQRTIASCYRTIYARARTGLAFIRTGVYIISISIVLMNYFGLGINTPFDLILIISGTLMIVDGLLWYLPVRKEQAELPRSRSSALGA